MVWGLLLTPKMAIHTKVTAHRPFKPERACVCVPFKVLRFDQRLDMTLLVSRHQMM